MNFDKHIIEFAKHLYVHVPFCQRKCPYCDFYSESVDSGSQKLISEYINALVVEMLEMREYAYVLETIYIGGGTPSIIGAKNLEILYEAIKNNFEISESAEITVEANPDSLRSEFAKTAFSLGINRISVGAQSFKPENLQFLGRVHSSEQIYQAVEIIKNASFTNFNVDLITALPGQSVSDVLHDLEHATSLNPAHLSVYNLIIEEDTPFENKFNNHEFELPGNEKISLIYDETRIFLLEKGYEQYEISNFARPGFESQHNLGYWRYENYIGIGASAQSFLKPYRLANKRSIADYINGDRSDFQETLTPAQQLDELLMLGLRTSEGIQLTKLAKYCRIEDAMQKIRQDFTLSGKMNISDELLAIKPEYFSVADAIILKIANILTDTLL